MEKLFDIKSSGQSLEHAIANSISKSQSFGFGEVSWVQKDQIPNLDLAYDMLPLMEMMEAPDKSEFFYPRRTEDDWEKKIFQSFTK